MKSIARMGYCALAVAGLSLLLGSLATAAPTGKIEICHKPGERNQRILVINEEKDGEKHFGHGDYVIAPEVCDGLDSDCEKPPVADNDVDCSDGIACTVDSCAGVAGCFHDPDDSQCDDNDPNTLDECSIQFGGCIYTPQNQAPVIQDQVFFVDENSPIGTIVGTVLASDPDQDGLTYGITGGDDSAFTIDSNYGTITVINGSLLDYETQTTFILQVTVTDIGNLTASANIIINLIDLPEGCPCDYQAAVNAYQTAGGDISSWDSCGVDFGGYVSTFDATILLELRIEAFDDVGDGQTSCVSFVRDEGAEQTVFSEQLFGITAEQLTACRLEVASICTPQ